jgi:hypothetical protein
MIDVELIKRSRSADAIGPCGSSTPAGLQEPRRMATPTAGQRKRERRSCCRKAVLPSDASIEAVANNPVDAPDPCSGKGLDELVRYGLCHERSLLAGRSIAIRRAFHRTRTVLLIGLPSAGFGPSKKLASCGTCKGDDTFKSGTSVMFPRLEDITIKKKKGESTPAECGGDACHRRQEIWPS